jgi:hypothetical protein
MQIKMEHAGNRAFATIDAALKGTTAPVVKPATKPEPQTYTERAMGGVRG